MKAPTCPSPERLIRVASGTATPRERSFVAGHVSLCDECRREMESIERLGPVEEWSRTDGRPEPMPETLWRAVSMARASLALRLKVRFVESMGDATRAGRSIAEKSVATFQGLGGARPWVDLVDGRADLMVLGMSPVRGGDASNRNAAGQGLSERIRAVAGPHEALLRRGKNSLTVVMTSHGAPASGRRLSLMGSGENRTAVTDSSGAAAFKELSEAEYVLELEGMIV